MANSPYYPPPPEYGMSPSMGDEYVDDRDRNSSSKKKKKDKDRDHHHRSSRSHRSRSRDRDRDRGDRDRERDRERDRDRHRGADRERDRGDRSRERRRSERDEDERRRRGSRLEEERVGYERDGRHHRPSHHPDSRHESPASFPPGPIDSQPHRAYTPNGSFPDVPRDYRDPSSSRLPPIPSPAPQPTKPPTSLPPAAPAPVAAQMDKAAIESAILSAEEIARQRREKVEKWRRERLAKEKEEAQTKEQAPVTNGDQAPDAVNGTGGMDVGSEHAKRKAWSLEDDDEEEEGAIIEKVPETLPTATSGSDLLPPPLKPLSQKKDADDVFSPAVAASKSITFSSFASKPTLSATAAKPRGPAFKPTTVIKTNPFASSFSVSKPKPKVGSLFQQDEEEATEGVQLSRFGKKIKLMQREEAEDADGATPMEGVEKEDDGEDALEAFMADVDVEVKKLQEEDRKVIQNASRSMAKAGAGAATAGTEGAPGESRPTGEGEEGDDANDDDDEDILGNATKKIAAKRKDLASVDHSIQNYEPFRKDFFVEPPELAALTDAEVDIKRAELGGIKIRGVNCPKPVDRWSQMGLPPGINDIIKRVLKYEHPSAIQAQAIPAIMSGRDVIGIAKTGSGKTIAFLLPMFRHIKDQRPLQAMDGPIALVMTPTRELAVQIHKECKPFMKALNLRAVCAYGGAPIKDQIAELKRGAEVIICTPGRMIDLLCANSGRVTNLKRVTYLVLDEADRMFDMGFEPQVMKMVNNIRPSRQTILFSATFPRKMEALARKILHKPVEITVGGRSTVSPDVHQIVEVRPEDTKFLRLLEILGLAMSQDPDTKVLIFVDRHEAADNLLRDLLRRGYPCQSLHGGKDQADRDSTIADFKSGDINIVIATSVAARGLDVKQLKVVVNYECPNHMEDYVHRCGRTGRAGNKGTAYTFITPDQDKYAVDIMQALKLSNVPIPEDMQALADSFIAKVKAGTANYSSSGFGGKGLDKLDKERDIVKRIQKKSHGTGIEEEEEEEEEERAEEDVFTDDDDDDFAGSGVSFKVKAVHTDKMKEREEAIEAAAAAAAAASSSSATAPSDSIQKMQEALAKANAQVGKTGLSKALDVVAQINQKFKKAEAAPAGVKKASDAAFAYEIEINDFPQKARWKVTNKEQIVSISELSGAAITTRGVFVPAGKEPGPGERKLHLFIEGETQLVIDRAKKEIKRILREATEMALEQESSGKFGRYLVTL
ncbi:pre-mRNA processing RNA-helicase [Chytridiales sp. JEL 0842]|nr:pre-mRNA processing RNA-helicase [Chytridiales sp. JEL 0842]